MNEKISVVIVEDDPELRRLLEQLIGKQDDMEVTRSFSNGRAFINDFKSLDVDVVIMDINMPGKTGIECISETKQICFFRKDITLGHIVGFGFLSQQIH